MKTRKKMGKRKRIPWGVFVGEKKKGKEREERFFLSKKIN